MEVVDIIKHYQRSLERCSGDEQRMWHCICRLYRLPVTVQHLQDTGVGRTVNALRKYEGEVGDAAKALVYKWKAMVAEAESSEEETSNNCERAKTESPPPKISDSKNRSHDLEVSDSHREHRTLEESKTSSRSQSNSNNSVKVYSKRSESKVSHYSTNKRRIEGDSSEGAEKYKKRVIDVQDEDEEEGNDSGRDSHEENGDSDASRNESDLNEESKVNSMEIDNINGDIQNLNQNDDLSPNLEDKIKYKSHSSSSSSKRERQHGSSSSHNRHSSHKHSANSVKNHSSALSNQEKSRRRQSDNAEHKHKNSEKKSESKSIVDSKSKDNKHNIKDKRREKETIKPKEKEKNKEKKIQSSDNKKDSKSEKVHSKSDVKSPSSKSSSSKSETKHKSSTVKKNKSTESTEDGIDSFSGTSFADALGMMGMMDSASIVKKKKKSNSSGQSSTRKSERPSENLPSTSSSSGVKSKLTSPKQQGKKSQDEINLLDPSLKLEPLDNFEMEMEVDVDATLPVITPNYRPLPHLNLDAHSRGRARTLTEEEALSQVMSTKNQRTKVYSGIKSGKSWATVPSLYDICVRVLQENIDALEYTGGVPYDLLKPVLTHATPDQLFVLEHYNPYLVEDTDELWKSHVNRKFRNKSRLDMETYREMFQRCVEESEAKLKALTMNIQNSMAKSVPVRQTKLAYVDSVAKPPRQVARKQAKYGTAHATPTTPLAKVQKLATPVGSGSGSNSSVNHVPPPPPPRVSHSVAKTKPRVAPLMQKTLKFAKSFKR